jgi:AcrR family transcriptional regulator
VIRVTIKDAKRNFIIDRATALFLERSLPAVTVRDVALASGVGEATVYRTFGGRAEIIVAAALKLQAEMETVFLEGGEGLSGFERLKRFYASFCEVFVTRPELYRFLSEFDAYCVSEGIPDLEEYADHMDRFKTSFLLSYETGLKDGSVKAVEDPELFYYSTTHAVLSLSKKLAAEPGVIRQDRATDAAKEIRTLIGLVLAALKK